MTKPWIAVKTKAMIVVRFEKTCGGKTGYLQCSERSQKARLMKPTAPSTIGVTTDQCDHGLGAPPVLRAMSTIITEKASRPVPK